MIKTIIIILFFYFFPFEFLHFFLGFCNAELERKAQEKRNPEFERKLLSWIEETISEKCSDPTDIYEIFEIWCFVMQSD